MAELNLIEAVRDALMLEMERDERVMVLGLDVGTPLGGVFRATAGLRERFGAGRVASTPLAEGAILGASLGLAVAGLVPVAEIQFLGFIHHAFHQLGPQIARFRFRSRGRHSLRLTIRAPFGGGLRMPEFHADGIEAQLANCPGLKVVAPSNPYDAKGLLLSAIRDPDPVVYLEPQRLYRKARTQVPDGDFTVPLGSSKLVRQGTDLTMVAWSAGVDVALQTADRLELEGLSAAVLDLRSLVPLDVEGLVNAVIKTRRCLVVQEGPYTAGFAAEVAATVQEEAFFSLESPVIRVCGHDTPYPPGGMEDWYLPSLDRIALAARGLVS
jgi:pyruvate dehydrogenase E1 component beta subunit